jgi:hypothetical protein
MRSVNATKFHRKSGGAKARDLRFRGPLLEMFSTERSGEICGYFSVLTLSFWPVRYVFPIMVSMTGRSAKTVRPCYLGAVAGAAGAWLAGGLGELPTAWALPGPPTCCTTGSLWSAGVNGGKGACGSV